MSVVTANDIKTKGIKAFEDYLKDHDEIGISIRGKVKYVVINVDEYERRRELELEKALKEAKKDIKDGKFSRSLDDHFKLLDKAVKK